MAASAAAIPSTAGTKPAVPSSAAPRRKPTPLTAFFEPVSTATQRKSPPGTVGASTFTALLALILARSLATPEAPCTAITKATEAGMLQAGSSCASASSATTCSPSPA